MRVPGTVFTREGYEQVRAAARAVERRDSFALAATSVVLGFAQLGFIRWADQNLPRSTAVRWEGGFFLAYALLIGWMVWRMLRRRRAAAPHCPACGQPLFGLSERVAVATGKCDRCGGVVIQPGTSP